MRDEGLGSWPARRARMTPDAIAVRHAGTTLTYANLRDRVAALASGLRAAGIKKGDRVAYLGPNHPVYLDLLFACGRLGAIFVPVNFRLTAPEIDYVLNDSGASLFIHTPEYPHTTTIPAIQAADTIPLAGDDPADEAVGLDDPCLIMYTSGSTGRPKGAILTHGNLTWNSVNVLVEMDLAGDERTLITAPMFHIASLSMTCLPTLLKGGTVILREKFDPAAVLATVERERVTFMFGVPTMFNALAGHENFAATDLTSVRRFISGGAAAPEDTLRRFLDRGITITQGYGLTETAPGVLTQDIPHVFSKLGSVGVPSFFTDVRLVDQDEQGRGEVVISGPNVTPGYWQRPDATADAIQDGWFHSGDIATVDEDGYYYLVDRVKDMIISGGENIYPTEVENEIYGYPGVGDCAVIGVPDEHWGEVGRAVIRPRPGASIDTGELLAFLRTRLAAYKVPKSVVFTDEMPTTGSGKIRKNVLRERYGLAT
ncbi:MAG TPA: long-chain fatty acid--CoA ligase [Pseudonocardiaceae bacterium]|nr:long-chain fatty acid--CoA ligase [Pseudonocardiaceae bacterium]